MLRSERSPLTPLNNQLPVPTRQNSIKSFRSLSSHNGYVHIDQHDVLSTGGAGSGSGSAQRLSLNSRQSSFRSVVGSLLFDAGPTSPHPTDYQYNDLSPPEQLSDDLKDGCELCDCHRDADTEASCSSRRRRRRRRRRSSSSSSSSSSSMSSSSSRTCFMAEWRSKPVIRRTNWDAVQTGTSSVWNNNIIIELFVTWWTRSTGTVHAFAKARLTSVAIRIRIRDPDGHQNLIICSFAHYQPSLKISCKSAQKFLHKVANR